MGTQTTPTTGGGGWDRTAQLASDSSQTRSGAFAPAVDGRPQPLAKPSVTHGSAAGGQGGSITVQYRRPAPLEANTVLEARTQQKSRQEVRSTVSVSRQWQAALAPGPMGTQTTPTTGGGGWDRTAQLASDSSQTRSGAFAPAVDGRPQPLAKPSVTQGSAAGGQGGSMTVQYRQSARVDGGSCVIDRRADRGSKTAPACYLERPLHLEDRGGETSKDRHVTRPPE